MIGGGGQGRPCKFGMDCNKFKQGTCTFLHDMSGNMPNTSNANGGRGGRGGRGNQPYNKNYSPTQSNNYPNQGNNYPSNQNNNYPPNQNPNNNIPNNYISKGGMGGQNQYNQFNDNITQ